MKKLLNKLFKKKKDNLKKCDSVDCPMYINGYGCESKIKHYCYIWD